MPHRAYCFRIYPTPDEAAVLESWAGASRFVYNAALEQRRDWWRQFHRTIGRHIGWVSQSREVTQARKEIPWLAATPRSILEYALKDLDAAYRAFFRTGGYPGFRSKVRGQSFRIQWAGCVLTRLNRKWGRLKFPKGLSVKIRLTRDIVGRANAIAVRRDADGWYVAIRCGAEAVPQERSQHAVGIDRGISASLCLSNGEMASLPASMAGKHALTVAAQRAMSRGKRGSVRRSKARARYARAAAVAARSRMHWLHERSTDIARRFGAVALEKLATANMTRAGKGKRGLNRSILEQGWATFAQLLDYKLAERGGELHYINPAYTSQTCSSCGSVDARSRKSQAVFECVDCGHRANADVNAAINILRRSPAGVEGSGCGPVEARTGQMLTHLENLAA